MPCNFTDMDANIALVCQEPGKEGDRVERWEHVIKLLAAACRAVRSGAKGRMRLHYVLRDKGPRLHVPATWVPQLQLHLLATGCHSVLLFTRSAAARHMHRIMLRLCSATNQALHPVLAMAWSTAPL